MSFRTLGFMLLIITQVAFAQGRKPAVEDFVGIEVDQPEGTPQGTEGLFNFEKDIDKFEHTKGSSSGVVTAVNTKTQDSSDLTTALVIAFMLGLPGMIWFLMMSNLRQKAKIESASNIEVLEKYRRERQEAKKAEEAFKKSA